jgi:hypothetical protein
MIRKRLSEINTFSTSHRELQKQRTKDQETKINTPNAEIPKRIFSL